MKDIYTYKGRGRAIIFPSSVEQFISYWESKQEYNLLIEELLIAMNEFILEELKKDETKYFIIEDEDGFKLKKDETN